MNPWDVLARQLTRLGDRIDALPSVREATVTGLSPLEVRFDTDTTGTVVFGTLTSGLTIGARVLTVRLARYVWVLGARDGVDVTWASIQNKPVASVSFGTGTARWVRVALLNGVAALNGASLEMQFGTGGNYGTIERYTGRIHFSQLGDNIVSCVVISDTNVPSTPVTFHTRQVSTYVFELWAALPTFNVPLTVWALNAFPSIGASAQLLMDSVQTSAPSSLSTAIVPLVAAT